MSTLQKRPLVVTVLGVLSQVVGVIFAFSGVAIIVLGMTAPFLLSDEMIMQNELLRTMPIEITAMLASLVGIIVLGIGIFEIIVGTGLMKAKKWAWTLEVISTFISLGIGVFYLIDDVVSGILTLVLNVLILYYLYRPNVKVYFGKTVLNQQLDN